MTGGWPGTLTEAHARVLEALGGSHPVARVSADRLRELARATYRAARVAWAAVADRDREDEEG